jgi:hypothetical protein
MKSAKTSHVLSLKKQASKWSAQDDFVLMMLVGKVSYAQIAMRLGRSASAVQRRASLKGYSAREGWRTDKKTRKAQLEALRNEMLLAGEEELSGYLEVPQEEEPLLPHPGSREYNRLYKQRQRKQG